MAEVRLTTADLVDRFGNELDVCELQFRDLGGRAAFSGIVRTLSVLEDNALVKQVLSEPGRGAVLVIDGGGSLRTALVGDVIAGLAMNNGWSGLIINGAIRDSHATLNLDIGIKALGTTPKVSGKTGTGKVDDTVTFGNVYFRPGEWVAADADGIVIRSKAP
jgi:regulator of ribonuclease activity A